MNWVYHKGKDMILLGIPKRSFQPYQAQDQEQFQAGFQLEHIFPGRLEDHLVLFVVEHNMLVHELSNCQMEKLFLCLFVVSLELQFLSLALALAKARIIERKD